MNLINKIFLYTYNIYKMSKNKIDTTIQTQKKQEDLDEYQCQNFTQCTYISNSVIKRGKFKILPEEIYDFIVNSPNSKDYSLIDLRTSFFKMFWNINLDN